MNMHFNNLQPHHFFVHLSDQNKKLNWPYMAPEPRFAQTFIWKTIHPIFFFICNCDPTHAFQSS